MAAHTVAKNRNLYKRHGVWYARVQIGGKEIRRSLQTKSAVEARRRVASLIQAEPNAPAAAMVSALAALDRRHPFYVYFIQGINGGPIKIGKSRNPRARLTGLQRSSAIKLQIVACIEGAADTEERMHERFAKDRLHGEWFRPSPRLKRFIRTVAAALNVPPPAGTTRAVRPQKTMLNNMLEVSANGL